MPLKNEAVDFETLTLLCEDYKAAVEALPDRLTREEIDSLAVDEKVKYLIDDLCDEVLRLKYLHYLGAWTAHNRINTLTIHLRLLSFTVYGLMLVGLALLLGNIQGRT